MGEETAGRGGMGVRTATCTIVALVVFLVVSITLTAIIVDAYRDCRFIEAGYTRQMLPGHDWPQWVKESPDGRSRPAPVPGLDPRNWVVSEPVPLSNAAGGDR